MKTITCFFLAVWLGMGNSVSVNEAPDQEVLDLALSGYDRAVATGQAAPRSLLTIIDYSRPSTLARFFVVDPDDGEVLHKSLVAHGKNSGANEATRFGNGINSRQSSLGFFVTGDTYNGRHGYSLRLHGLEPGINDNALQRNIVIHGANYVSEEYAARNGRLGRSWGCPALPQDMNREIIDLIKGGSCVFIYGDDSNYRYRSAYIGRTKS